MSQRLSRKEMKRDDFATAVGRSVEYAESHTRNLLLALGAVVAIAALAVGLYAFFSHRSAAADVALSRAIKVYAAPIQATDAKPNDADEPSFPDAAARRKRAVQLLNEVRDRYAHTGAAAIAGVYLGQIAANEGKLAEARTLWTDYADRSKSSLAAVVRLDLIDLDRQQGKGEALVGRLKPMLDEADPQLPKDTVLYQLGLTYEELQRRTEAVGAYRQLLDEFPQSSYRTEVQQKLTALDPTHAGSPLSGLGGLGGPGGAPGL